MIFADCRVGMYVRIRSRMAKPGYTEAECEGEIVDIEPDDIGHKSIGVQIGKHKWAAFWPHELEELE